MTIMKSVRVVMAHLFSSPEGVMASTFLDTFIATSFCPVNRACEARHPAVQAVVRSPPMESGRKAEAALTSRGKIPSVNVHCLSRSL